MTETISPECAAAKATNVAKSASCAFVIVVLAGATVSCDSSETGSNEWESQEAADSGVVAVASSQVSAPFPDGYDYPLDAEVLEDYVREGKLHDIRHHAWSLFAGINQDAGGPKIWETWYTQVEAFSPTNAGSEQGSARVVPGLSERRAGSLSRSGLAGSEAMPSPQYGDSCDFEGVRFLDNGDILIAGVLYDASAYSHIRNKGYFLSSTLEGLRNQGETPGGRIEEFPRESISVKHMYWPVRGHGKTALPVWDFPAMDPDAYNGYETWTRAVAIDPTREVIPEGETADVSYLFLEDKRFPEQTFEDANVVSIDRFFHYKISKNELRRMDSVDRCILNQSARWSYGRDFKGGDYIVSVAMHVVTKEFAPWTMQTFWWHDNPELAPWGDDRPDRLTPPGLNYLMCTAYTMEEVCYNPYIELVVPEPGRILSNCQNCHFRGAWPASKPPWKHAAGVAYYDAGQRGYSSLEDPIFKGLVWTDFSWAIPLAARDQD